MGVGLQQGCVLSPLFLMVYMSWINSHSRVDEGVAVGSYSTNRFLLADDLVLLPSSE